MNTNNEMTFLEHILELRSRLLKIFFSIIFFSIIGYLNSNLIISFLLYPVSDPHIRSTFNPAGNANTPRHRRNCAHNWYGC